MSEEQTAGKSMKKIISVLLLLLVIAGIGIWFFLGRDGFRFDRDAGHEAGGKHAGDIDQQLPGVQGWEEQGDAAHRKRTEQPLQHEGEDHGG